jgi:hypothetical protein
VSSDDRSCGGGGGDDRVGEYLCMCEGGGTVPQSTYFPRDETGLVFQPTQLERTLQLYW